MFQRLAATTVATLSIAILSPSASAQVMGTTFNVDTTAYRGFDVNGTGFADGARFNAWGWHMNGGSMSQATVTGQTHALQSPMGIAHSGQGESADSFFADYMGQNYTLDWGTGSWTGSPNALGHTTPVAAQLTTSLLTSAGFDQWKSIRDQGLTGAYTLSLDGALAGSTTWTLFDPGSGYHASGSVQAGATEFTLNVTQVLSSSAQFSYYTLLGMNTVTDIGLDGTVGTADDLSSTAIRSAQVFYVGTQVPAPGALALLGLAGAAGRRRRRS